MRRRRKLGRAADRVLFYGTLLALLAFFLFPLFWMILSSLKTNVEVTAFPPLWLFWPTLRNYVDVFAKNPFFSYMVNSTIVAVARSRRRAALRAAGGLHHGALSPDRLSAFCF